MSNRSRQHLIPITPEVREAAINLDASQPKTSTSEKQFSNSSPIRSLLRNEVQNILHELSFPDKFIRKEEIDDLIEKCLKKKGTIVQEKEASSALENEAGTSQGNKNKLIAKNLEILKQRITNVEERLSSLQESVSETPDLQARKFKINLDVIKGEVHKLVKKKEIPAINTIKIGEGNRNEQSLQTKLSSTYDDIYYTRRAYYMNLLTYKKSLESIKLNAKPKFNPHKKPIN